MEETWCTCVENRDYEISDLGRVRSIDRLVTRKGNGPKFMRGQILRPGASKSGHLSVVLGRAIGTKQVHQLVMSAFVGPKPVGFEILHLDHTPANNRLTNLKYGTRAENVQMDYDADRRDWAKQVIALLPDGSEIRFRQVTEAAKHFGVSQPTVSVALRMGWPLRYAKVRFKYVV